MRGCSQGSPEGISAGHLFLNRVVYQGHIWTAFGQSQCASALAGGFEFRPHNHTWCRCELQLSLFTPGSTRRSKCLHGAGRMQVWVWVWASIIFGAVLLGSRMQSFTEQAAAATCAQHHWRSPACPALT